MEREMGRERERERWREGGPSTAALATAIGWWSGRAKECVVLSTRRVDAIERERERGGERGRGRETRSIGEQGRAARAALSTSCLNAWWWMVNKERLP